MDREAAQARLNRVRTFTSELAALEQGGVVALDESQRRAIADHHRRLLADLTAQFDLDRDDAQRRMSAGMRIASLAGAVALSAAVVLLFFRIWGDLSATQQVGILLSAPLVGVALTEAAHRFDRSRHFVFLAAVIACAAIVLNVMMVGDIFAMTDSPNALGVWAAFALLIGYAYGLRLPVAAGLGLAIGYAAGALLAWRGLDWKEFGRRPELLLPLAAAIACIGAATADGPARRFAPTYRMVGLFVLFASLWALSISVDLSVLSWTADHVKALYQVLGFATAAVAVAIGLKRDWNDTTNLAAAAFLVFLYTKFVQWWWDWMPAYLFFFTIGGISIVIILVLNRARTALVARTSS